MRRNTYAIIVTLITCASVAEAQITISDADMPAANDIYPLTAAVIDTAIHPEQTGAGYTWDYSFLQTVTSRADTFVPVSATPLAYQFFFNNSILYPNHKADYALRGMDLSIQAIQITDRYDYFKLDPGDYKNVGFGANINGVPTSVRYDPIDFIYRFPMNFGNMDTSDARYGFQIPGIGYYGQEILRYNVVDGWGTVMTPAGSYQALRIRSELHTTDTIYIDSLGYGFNTPRPTQIEYKWLAPGQGEPVLKIIADQGFIGIIVQSVEYLGSPSSVEEKPLSDNLIVYPNPSRGAVHVLCPGIGSINMYNCTGQIVYKSAVKDMEDIVDITGIAPGLYKLIYTTRNGKRISHSVLISR